MRWLLMNLLRSALRQSERYSTGIRRKHELRILLTPRWMRGLVQPKKVGVFENHIDMLQVYLS